MTKILIIGRSKFLQLAMQNQNFHITSIASNLYLSSDIREKDLYDIVIFCPPKNIKPEAILKWQKIFQNELPNSCKKVILISSKIITVKIGEKKYENYQFIKRRLEAEFTKAFSKIEIEMIFIRPGMFVVYYSPRSILIFFLGIALKHFAPKSSYFYYTRVKHIRSSIASAVDDVKENTAACASLIGTNLFNPPVYFQKLIDKIYVQTKND